MPHAFPMAGPEARYRFVLFVEKEGFAPLLEKAAIANRHDLTTMSTEGMTVTASRQLVKRLSECGVTVLVLCDFDKSGFSIVHTLGSDTRRFSYRTPPRVIDLGLRLEDVRQLDLQKEAVAYPSSKDPRVNLRESGASEEECCFLVNSGRPGHWTGERVELNARRWTPRSAAMSWRARPRGAIKTIWSRLRSLRFGVVWNTWSRRSASVGGNWMRIMGGPLTAEVTRGERMRHRQWVHA